MRVTSKGQVTIPKAVRDRLGIAPGTDVGFSEEGALVVRNDQGIVEGESPGARIARKLIELGERARREGWASAMTSDEFLKMTRGPFDDVDPR
jgi:AbrB family looped-hinge helix DNA binding protein